MYANTQMYGQPLLQAIFANIVAVAAAAVAEGRRRGRMYFVVASAY